MQEVKNLIFDFDGTLADTSKLIVATMQRSVEQYGLPYRNEEQIRATIGVRLEEIPSILWPHFMNLGKPFATVYRRNFEYLKNEIPVTLFPNVKETLADLKKEGLNMAIATSRSKKSVVELTVQFGIKEYFDCMVGGNEVAEGKPNPESIFRILKDENWNVDETMMVGDMTVDILMGKNAGVLTCGVSYGNGKRLELEDTGANYVVASFPEIKDVLK